MTVFNLSNGAVNVLDTEPATAPAIKFLNHISLRETAVLSPKYIDCQNKIDC